MKQTTATKAYKAYAALSGDIKYYVVTEDGRVIASRDKLAARGNQYQYGGEILTAKQAQKRGLVS